MGVGSKCLTWLLNMRSMILVILVLGLLINESLSDGGVITGALITSGATLFGGLIKGGGGKSSGSQLWQLQNGQIIDANNCWESGQGHCPNGNCLDDGGILIKENIVDCGWACGPFFIRQHCKVQICCVSMPDAVSSGRTGPLREIGETSGAGKPWCKGRNYSGGKECCESEDPENTKCTEGQGDCDSDAGCAGDLVCGRNNCRQYHSNASSKDDCCTKDV